MRAVRHGSRLVFGLENLAEVVLRKYHRVLLIGRMQSRIAHIEQISAQGQVRAMFLQNAKGQQACALRLLNGAAEVRSEEHTSELQSRLHLVCRLLLEKKKNKQHTYSACSY